jgi:hypothetical protein
MTAGHLERSVSVEAMLTRTQAVVPADTSNILDDAKLKRSSHVRGYPRRTIEKVRPMNRTP